VRGHCGSAGSRTIGLTAEGIRADAGLAAQLSADIGFRDISMEWDESTDEQISIRARVEAARASGLPRAVDRA
jgi:hypothetical protein